MNQTVYCLVSMERSSSSLSTFWNLAHIVKVISQAANLTEMSISSLYVSQLPLSECLYMWC